MLWVFQLLHFGNSFSWTKGCKQKQQCLGISPPQGTWDLLLGGKERIIPRWVGYVVVTWPMVIRFLSPLFLGLWDPGPKWPAYKWLKWMGDHLNSTYKSWEWSSKLSIPFPYFKGILLGVWVAEGFPHAGGEALVKSAIDSLLPWFHGPIPIKTTPTRNEALLRDNDGKQPLNKPLFPVGVVLMGVVRMAMMIANLHPSNSNTKWAPKTSCK